MAGAGRPRAVGSVPDESVTFAERARPPMPQPGVVKAEPFDERPPEALSRPPNDWRSAARPRGSAATEGLVSCNGRVRQQPASSRVDVDPQFQSSIADLVLQS
jgi:hypothetical protein